MSVDIHSWWCSWQHFFRPPSAPLIDIFSLQRLCQTTLRDDGVSENRVLCFRFQGCLGLGVQVYVYGLKGLLCSSKLRRW